jgi:3-methyl-2-oxobutanoate hydroxymethyltransferase
VSSPNEAKRIATRDLQARKRDGTKLVMVSAYDALFARLADDGGVDALLVGDSLGNVIAGYGSTLPVRLEHMIYHAGMVVRGSSRAMVLVDMPFLTYQVSVDDAMRNCGRAIQESGAQAVKLEGGSPEIAEAVRAVVRLGVPVMGHIGFTPQAVNALGGYRVQGKETEQADRLMDEARRLEDAGAFAIVLELVPAAVARRITAAVAIPTIGIGAGAGCDGQVLVLLDLLGLNDAFSPRFLKRYATMADDVRSAVRTFGDEVRRGVYPDADHSF